MNEGAARVVLDRRGRVGVIRVSNPPLNLLSTPVRAGLLRCLDEIALDDSLDAAVLHCDGASFIAGFDVTEFGRPAEDPHLRIVVQRYEDSAKPVVAAVHGHALGGGLELAMACHYRVSTPQGRLGLPEVRLGLLPGCGGTQRLPRLAGAKAALRMICTGAPADALEAWRLGIVDEVASDHVDAAVRAAARLASTGKLRRVGREPPRDEPSLRHDFAAMSRVLQNRYAGFLAPRNCMAAVEAGCTLPLARGLERERTLFEELLDSGQRAAQFYLFFAERRAARAIVPSRGGRRARFRLHGRSRAMCEWAAQLRDAGLLAGMADAPAGAGATVAVDDADTSRGRRDEIAVVEWTQRQAGRAARRGGQPAGPDPAELVVRLSYPGARSGLVEVMMRPGQEVQAGALCSVLRASGRVPVLMDFHDGRPISALLAQSLKKAPGAHADWDAFAPALADAAARCMVQRPVRQSSDIDVVCTNGFGYPRYLGGPLFHTSRQDLTAAASKRSAPAEQ